MKTSHFIHTVKHSGNRLLAMLCALLLVATVLPLSVAATEVGGLYEGWRHISNKGTAAADCITYDPKTHSLTMDAMGSAGEFLFLNRTAADGLNSGDANLANFSADGMTDFVIEFDMSVTNYAGKAAVDGGDLGAGSGSVGLAFMGTDAGSLFHSNITAYMEYATTGLLVYKYPNVGNPINYTQGYVEGQNKQWHWLLNYSDTRHVKVTKSGNTISMDVNNGYVAYTATLPDNVGYPAAGYIGLAVKDATVTFSNVKVTNNTAGQQTYDQFFVSTGSAYGGNFEGWQQMSLGNGAPENYVTYNATTHALHVSAAGGNTQALYLNRLSYDDVNSGAENLKKFSADTMTDFVIEFDTALDADSLGNGAISLALMGKDGGRLDICSINSRIDPNNIGFLWRNYYDVSMPSAYQPYSYVDNKVEQYHWRFTATEIFHTKVVKVGHTLTITVTNSTGVLVKNPLTVTLPDNIGLPEAGLVGLLVENANLTISNVGVTNTTPGHEAYTKFFTDPKANLLGSYEGWQYATTGSSNGVTHSDVYRELHINAMDGQVHSLLLNREAGDGINSSKENLEKFGVSEMQDFVIEFDLAVNNYQYKDDENNSTGGGKFGLAFLSDSTGRLDTASLTAQADYGNAGLYWNAYRDIPVPGGYTNNYVNGVIAKQWHWLFNDNAPRHVKVVKSGNTVTMDILNGYVNATYTLSDTLPASGFVGLMAQNVDVTVTNLTVTNTTDGRSDSATFFVPPTLVASEQHKGVTLQVYEQAGDGYLLEVSGKGAVPTWITTDLYAAYAAAIDTVVVDEGFTSIGYGAFMGLSAVEKVILPSTLTAIGGEAFKECQNLKSINLEEGLTSIGYAAFLKSGLTQVTIPDSVTTMGTWVFANCKSLVSVTFGASKLAKKTLPARTFSGCTALKTVNFGSVLQIIDDYAFFQSGLEELTLPANIKAVDNAAFYKAALKSVKIADGGATYLGWASFYGCSSLESVNLGNSLKNISTWVFTACNRLTKVAVPDTVTGIGRRTFSWCHGLETVSLSAGMTEIKEELFYGSSKLTDVVIPEGITAIGDKAFYNCRALMAVKLPSTVTAIGDKAFINCYALENVYVGSAVIAEGLTSKTAYGDLLKSAKTVAVRSDIASVPAFVKEKFTYVGSKTTGGVGYITYSDSITEGKNWEKYNLDCFMEPVWKGNVVYNESVMFVPNAKTGVIEPAPLLYKPDKVLEVRSGDLTTVYEEGVDYVVTADGKIQLTDNSRIYRWAYDDYYCKTYSQFGLPSISAPGRYLLYSEGDTFWKTQICVTYTHSDTWSGYVPEYAGNTLSKTLNKLKNKDSLKIVYNGDSVAEGCNASGWLNQAPYVPSWTNLVTEQLQAAYGGPISAVNTAVGGMTAEWGRENVQENIIKHAPDLVVLRFGTNDATHGMSSATFKANMKGMIDAVRAVNPNCEFILVANTLCNPDVGEPFTRPAHSQNQQALLELAQEYSGVAVARMLDVEGTLLQHKRYWDMTGNNINHYNDFMTRVQASVVSQLLVEDM